MGKGKAGTWARIPRVKADSERRGEPRPGQASSPLDPEEAPRECSAESAGGLTRRNYRRSPITGLHV
jgi:hypothetical protein